MKIIRSILLNVFTGVSITIVLLMVAVAYSDRLHPADHPTLACAGMAFPAFLIANVIMLMLWLIVKWRRAWIPVLGFVLAFPAIRVYLPLNIRAEAPPQSIKLVSFNVGCYTHGAGGKTDHEALVAIHDYVRSQNADIVCLQEDMTSAKDTTYFQEFFPYNDTVHVNRPRSSYVNVVSIHSRFPVVRNEQIRFESLANGSVAFYLKIDDDTVIVVNNHLESTHLTQDDRDIYKDIISGSMDGKDTKAETRQLLGKLSAAMVTRAQQAEAVHHYIESHNNYPIIVCGDFNDTPISYVRRTIAQGLTDCFVESGCGLGISFTQKGFAIRIDNILCSAHFEPYGCYVDNSVKASDHYPIICWLKKQ